MYCVMQFVLTMHKEDGRISSKAAERAASCASLSRAYPYATESSQVYRVPVGVVTIISIFVVFEVQVGPLQVASYNAINKHIL